MKSNNLYYYCVFVQPMIEDNLKFDEILDLMKEWEQERDYNHTPVLLADPMVFGNRTCHSLVLQMNNVVADDMLVYKQKWKPDYLNFLHSNDHEWVEMCNNDENYLSHY